ncbi:MAG: tRNA 5-methoxyuridine(34)/uridine 5-oxyacetic acid(34) synthase CmoB [Cellvibrionales bacterium]|nr:tRNA 5-methoxyuridine(34)/uridine 5-oxyacetic acid(34) synthase CmoB [Cellvibrionales bacterium]
MLNHTDFFSAIAKTALNKQKTALEEALDNRASARTFGEQAEWQKVLDSLPNQRIKQATFDQDIIKLEAEHPLTNEQKHQFSQNLMQLHPWRKGPFSLFDVLIDTEWRSDWKWQRLIKHLSPLEGKRVLDVGCGSGYHALRMYGEKASLVLGIEPMLKYIYQFQVVKQYCPDIPVFVLPLLCEDLPKPLDFFDTVFSMGVLYHRKSPIEHLEELKHALKPGGELVLETLIVEGDETTTLMPVGRYAQMRNVWFLPSHAQLCIWLTKTGFKNVRVVDINQTSLNEQRKTDWMTFQSLEDFLDPSDKNKTLEGYPAPKRVIILANK